MYGILLAIVPPFVQRTKYIGGNTPGYMLKQSKENKVFTWRKSYDIINLTNSKKFVNH